MAARKPKAKSAEPDDQSAYSAVGSRAHKGWTPAHFALAEARVASGDYMLAATICEWLLTDDRVAAGLDVRLEGLFGLQPAFEPAGDRRRSNKAVKALEIGEDWWESYPAAELMLIHKWALLLGVSVARHHAKASPEHGGRILPNPRFWHPQSLKRDPMTGIWTVRNQRGAELVVDMTEGEWLLEAPFGGERPGLQGLWRSLANWVLLKHWARGDSGTAGQKASTAVVTSPEGSTKEQRQELANKLLASGADRLAVLASGYDMKLLELSAQTGQLYAGQVDMANSAITIRIRGGNLSTEVTAGSHAAAKVQERTNDQPKLRFDADAVSTFANKQSLSWWAFWNFGDKALAPWPAYPVEPEEDKKSSAETLKTVGEGLKIFDDLGFEIDPKGVVDRFELDFITGRKDPADRPPPAPKPGTPPAPAGKQPQAKAGLRARLTSGDSIADAQGFVAGQLYADDVADSATAAALDELEPTLQAIGRELDEASSYEDLRARLIALYPKLDPARLSELVYRAMLLGDLAGRHAVTRDG